MAACLGVVDPKSLDKAVRQFRGLLFPEEGYDELKYLKKAQDMFKRLRELDMRVKPF